MIDSHLHYSYFNESDLHNIITKSPYYDKYMLYHSVLYDKIDITKYLKTCEKAFLIPFVYKEMDIGKSNTELYNFAKKYNNIFCLPLIGDNSIIDNHNILGMKEHFLVHNCFDVCLRDEYYSYLNKKKKILLIHCDDSVRLKYIKYLREKYPDMILMIAHLGEDRKNIANTIQFLERYKNDLNIYFDISTVFDEKVLLFAKDNLIIEHILYGSDLPYGNDSKIFEKYISLHKKIFNESQLKNIYSTNAQKLIEKILANNS